MLLYKTGQSWYYLNFWNLARTSNAPVFDGEGARHDVASFWQFSPCGDLLMLVTQAGANPATSDYVDFLFTSNGRQYREVHLAPQQGDPSATVLTKSDQQGHPADRNGCAEHFDARVRVFGDGDVSREHPPDG